MKKYAIGIDLHGTMINEEWRIEKALVPIITGLISSLKNRCDLYICTGNNYEFVDRYVYPEIRNEMSGYILETGAVYSDKKRCRLLISEEERLEMKSLEAQLRKMKLPDALYFAERVATISIFTKHCGEGKAPYRLWEEIGDIISNLGLSSSFNVTHSDVAIDIVTAGVSKLTGLKKVAAPSQIIAIADSFNDWDLLNNATLSFIPANSNILEKGEEREQPFAVKPLSEFKGNGKDVVYKSSFSYTEGLIDILEMLNEWL